MIRNHKKWAAAVAFIALLLGGVAFAYFTATGTGTGNATTGTATQWEVQVSTGTGGNLTPTSMNAWNSNDGAEAFVYYTVINNSSGYQYLHTVTFHVQDGWTHQSTNHPDCTKDDFSLEGAQPGQPNHYDLNTNVPPGGFAGQNAPFRIRMIDNGLDQDACQGVTVPITVDAS